MIRIFRNLFRQGGVAALIVTFSVNFFSARVESQELDSLESLLNVNLEWKDGIDKIRIRFERREGGVVEAIARGILRFEGPDSELRSKVELSPRSGFAVEPVSRFNPYQSTVYLDFYQERNGGRELFRAQIAVDLQNGEVHQELVKKSIGSAQFPLSEWVPVKLTVQGYHKTRCVGSI
ncbi:MAG: hypothetical protein KDD61_06325 [Bdellovibrionales bacterium]|nr:hypothetical protein [Bdellovibrionales bacterium]